jgi:uncharacterized protein with GYD domain
MKRRQSLKGFNMKMPKMNKLALVTVVGIGLACMTTSAISQQAPVMHKYLSRAVLTAEGIRDLQRQPPTKLKEGIAKFAASVGGKLEAWYFDAANGIGWAILDYPDDIAAASAALTVDAAGFARITLYPLLTAEDADKAVAKAGNTQPPQRQ